MELKLNGAVQSVSSAVVLLEKSTVAALRTENEVRSSGARYPATVYALHFSAQNLQEQISRLRAELKVPHGVTILGCAVTCVPPLCRMRLIRCSLA